MECHKSNIYFSVHLSQYHKENTYADSSETGVQVLDCAFKIRIFTYRVSPIKQILPHYEEWKDELATKAVDLKLLDRLAIKCKLIKINSLIQLFIGWFLNKFLDFEVNINKLNPLRLSSYAQLPKSIREKKSRSEH